MPTRALLEHLATWVERIHRPERGAVGWLVIGVIIGMILVVVLIIQLIIPGDGD